MSAAEYRECNLQKREPNLLKLLETFRILPTDEQLEDTSQRVQALRSKRPGLTNARVAKWYIRWRAVRASAAGSVAALPGAIPGLGTAAQVVVGVTTFAPDLWFILREMAHLHYEVAAAFEQDLHSEDIRTHLLLALGLTTGVVVPSRKSVTVMGSKVAISQFRAHVPGRWFQLLNRRLGVTVLTKFGVKRGGVAVGRLIPLGVGIGINAAANYATIYLFGCSSLRLYEKLLPPDPQKHVRGQP